MSEARGKLYNMVWRWHFYAGLFVAPFVLILAVTGSIYLFQPQIENWLYRDLYNVTAGEKIIPADAQLASVLNQFPDSRSLAYMPPESIGRSALVRIMQPDWKKLTVAVNPYDGKVLGAIDDDNRPMQIVRNIHGKLLSGKTGQAIMELAASWAMVLLVTGLYLWWPRQRSQIFGTILPRLSARGRIFWRDVHAVTGFWVSVILVFLILTGLPWSLVAGKVINTVQNHSGGAPETGVGWDGGGSKTVKSANQGWATDHAENMAGTGISKEIDGAEPLELDAVVAIAKTMKDIKLPYEIRLPVDSEGVYSIVNVHESEPSSIAYIHIDQYSGAVVKQARWADFSPMAKSISLGVFIHEGRYFGIANQLLGLFACLGLVLMITAGIIMWWRRKPQGKIGAPRVAKNVKAGKAVITIAVVLSLLMPLMGASLLMILMGEFIYNKWRGANAQVV